MTMNKDGGFGWAVVFLSFLLSILLIAPLASFGVLYNDLMYTFSTSNTVVSWIASINTGVSGFGGIVTGPLVKVYGARKTCVGGTLLSFVGFLSSAFTPNIYVLYLTYGLICGAGTCVIVTATTVIVNEYFDRKRAMATALLMCGISTGVFIWPPFARFLTDEFGWRGSLVVQSAIVANGFPISGLLRPFKTNTVRNNTDSSKDTDGKKEEKANCMSGFATLCRLLYRNPLLLVVGFGSFAENTSFMLNAFFIVPLATSLGIAPQRAALLLSVKGVGGFLGRVFVILFGDRGICDRMWLFALATALFGVVTMSVTILSSYWLFAICFALCGFFPGVATSLQAPVLVDIISIEELPLTYGYAMMCFGISSILSPLIAGVMGDVTGAYTLPFLTHGGVTLLGGLLLCAVPLVKRCGRSTNQSADLHPASPSCGEHQNFQEHYSMLQHSNKPTVAPLPAEDDRESQCML